MQELLSGTISMNQATQMGFNQLLQNIPSLGNGSGMLHHLHYNVLCFVEESSANMTTLTNSRKMRWLSKGSTHPGEMLKLRFCIITNFVYN